MQAVLAAKQWLTFTSGSPLQPAVAHALDHEPDWPPRSRATCRDAATCSAPGSRGRPGPGRAGGHLLPTTDVSHLGWPDGEAFCRALPERAGVVAIPTQGFYDDREAGRQLVRWAFCKEPDVISEGVRRLAAVSRRGLVPASALRPRWRRDADRTGGSSASAADLSALRPSAARG